MTWSFRLCKILGTEIRIDATCLLFVLLVAFPLLGEMTSIQNVVIIFTVVVGIVGVLYTCITIHEFAHILMGRRFGIDTKRITIFIFGGAAHMERIPFGIIEFYIAIVGPLSSFLLGCIFWLIALIFTGPAEDIIGGIGTLNMLLAGFNVAPIFPLDGGRMLRGLLYVWLKKPIVSTKIAVMVSLITLPIIFYFFIPLSVLSVILGALIIIMAFAELSFVKNWYWYEK